MHFKRTVKVESQIPTGSMGDIVFLLLIFFMATTIFKLEEGLTVNLPRAEAGKRVQREKITHVWVDIHGRITIDDKYLSMQAIQGVLARKLRENPQLLVGLNADAGLSYDYIDNVLMQLRKANAINVSFTNQLETR